MTKKNRPRIEPRFDAPKKTPVPKDILTDKKKAKPKKTKSTKIKKWSFRSFLKKSFYWGCVLGLWAALAIGALLLYYAAQLPQMNSWSVPKRPPNIKIVSMHGDLIANRGDTGGESVRLEHMPSFLPQAVIAMEDRRFYYHFGIDPIGLGRAIIVNLKAGRIAAGGSTLTQQLAKNLFLTPERTFSRKMQELVMALWLEASHSKDEILEMYLNRVYFGAGSYGVDGASKRYFNKNVENINLSEAAMLAGVLVAPSRYAPNRNIEGAKERTKLVLKAMVRSNYITQNEADLAFKNPASVQNKKRQGSANYVADWVMEELDDYIGLIETDITVETTLDLTAQRLATNALLSELNKIDPNNKLQGAVISLDNSGAVRAMVGGRYYAESAFNRATQAKRQPGSAFKPFVYMAALEQGYTPQTILRDEPTRIGTWQPQNYTKTYRGEVKIADALALSLNTIAAQLTAQIGTTPIIRLAQRLGIQSELENNPSLSLGTSEVTPLELTTAYAPLANAGYGVVPHIIQTIKDASGNILYQRKGSGLGRSLNPEIIADMNLMLARTLLVGTGKKAQLQNRLAAGKTGTTQGARDAWFVGYTPQLISTVWIGRDDNKPMNNITGGGAPATIWKRYMNAVHKNMPALDLYGVNADALNNFDAQSILRPPSRFNEQISQPQSRPPSGPGRDGISGRDERAPANGATGEAIGNFLKGIFGR